MIKGINDKLFSKWYVIIIIATETSVLLIIIKILLEIL